jgi:maltose/moltooligosaccharide transporter
MSSISSLNKPRLSFWQIWNMSFGFLGIQFGFALQNANTSRIFETLGADTSNLALYWLAAPITGLIVQPIIGFYSDRTWHKTWGRRRPFFAIGALLAAVALCLMPNSSVLWMAVGVLWIMDASINISMEPFRAFVGDMLPGEQRTSGFAMQSFFIGIGAIVASFMPWVFTNWLNISNTADAGIIPDSVKYSFYLGAFMLFITVMWTVFTTKEYPPDVQSERDLNSREKRKIDNEQHFRKRFFDIGLVLLLIGIGLAVVVYLTGTEKEIYVLAFGFGLFGVVHILSAIYISQGRSYLGIVNMVRDFNTMPKTMLQLAFVQFFSWFALFAMWIYTTPAVTSYIFNATDTTTAAYNDGADLVGNLFGIYNGIAALAALLLPVLARYTSRRITHMIALVCGGLGLISFYFISEPNYLYISMIGVGVAWASILSVPYAMLSGALPAEKMGYYMGVFNFFIVIPQIVAGTVLGFMLNHFFHGQSIYILITGGISMLIAGLLCLRVNDEDEVVIKQNV